jgi:hypothetical protein
MIASSRRHARIAQRGSDSRPDRNTGPLPLPPAHALSQLPSPPGPVTSSHDRPSSGSPSGSPSRTIQVASPRSPKPAGARSSRAKLSLTAKDRDGSAVASASGAVTPGLRVIAFGYNCRWCRGLLHRRELNAPGYPCDRQTASHQDALLATAAPSSPMLRMRRSNQCRDRLSPHLLQRRPGISAPVKLHSDTALTAETEHTRSELANDRGQELTNETTDRRTSDCFLRKKSTHRITGKPCS